MTLKHLFEALVDVCDETRSIEADARQALLICKDQAVWQDASEPLPQTFLQALSEPDAHPVCDLIARTSLPWSVPQTSNDPQYVSDSQKKLIVELIGPDGLVQRPDIRVGLYGIAPKVHYGFRTHPAEEIFVMLAGRADWAQGNSGFATLGAGGRAHHLPMVRHATVTTGHAFMSLYVWRGDVSFDDYAYQGKQSE